jgi:putative DNA primase/helicase
MGLLEHHAALLVSSAIELDVAESAGVVSIASVDELPEPLRWARSVPGVLFPWRSVDGTVVHQYRPDDPVVTDDGKSRKYLFPTGCGSIVNVHPVMADRIGTARRLVIVEGTKQYLAAVSAAPEGVAVVGIAGCWGWSRDGVATADLLSMVPAAGEVVVVFDADMATNRTVHDAATRLRETLFVAGAADVRFVQLPAGGKAGLDDVLAGMPDRRAAFAALLERASDKLPRKPKAAAVVSDEPVDGPPQFFDEYGLKAEQLRKAVRAREHLAVDAGGRVLVYRSGVYVDGRQYVVNVVSELLGDMYRQMHLRSLLEPLEAELHAEGRVIPERPARALVNVRNGMLDPFTGELHEHSPEHLSVVQFPIDWQPGAVCTTFDAWLDEVTDGRAADLLEAAAQVLDMRGERQRKALFLHGPTRSGKSTLIRLLENLVGHAGRSAVTLHELSDDKFAKADLYGKVLNTANELSSAHVDDVSAFKLVTGDDPVRAQHKFGHPFTFHNRAMFVFAGNELPTVGEVSGAYLARIRPYRFPASFEGREDPTLEARLRDEMPGILVRLVEALRRFEARGGYADDDASRSALSDFARRSDRVRLFLFETCDTTKKGSFTPRPRLFESFEEWARQNRRQSLGRHRFFDSVESAGYRVATRNGVRGFVGLALRPQDDWGAPDEPEPQPEPAEEPAQGAMGAEHPLFPPTSVSESVVKGESESFLKGEWAEAAPLAPCPAEREELEF